MTRHTRQIRVRLGTSADAPGILAIYAPHVAASPVTFETEIPALSAFEERLESIRKTYPLIVADADGTVAGYAYAHRIGERAAFAWNAELSVYIDPAFQGEGLGLRLCSIMLELLAEQGVRNVFSLITVPNEASIGLHESLGFSVMGIQRQAGYKCGAWHDVAWLQKQIGSFSGEPHPLVPLTDLDPALVDRILAEASE